MHRVIRARELPPSPGGTVTFEGEPYGAPVSFFLIDNEPGAGPKLHKHPYPETWIVREGRARFSADGEELEAGRGDVVVVGSETAHKYTNVGSDRLRMVCIHASARMVQEDLE
ncbi:MAG: cupin domain-containing protein [Actinomycetota bacterium]|nr:cupin domain-containing protein [Actinomycetota bacterium]